jgi:hypothetical protein
VRLEGTGGSVAGRVAARHATLLRLPAARLLPPLVLAFIAATFAVGLILDANGERLGTPRPPMAFDVDVRGELLWALVAVAVLAAAVAIAPRLRTLRPAPFALAVFGLALVVRLAVGAVRFGPEGWDEPWAESFNAKNEYVPSLPAIDALGVRYFLDRFDEILPRFPSTRPATRPGSCSSCTGSGSTRRARPPRWRSSPARWPSPPPT